MGNSSSTRDVGTTPEEAAGILARRLPKLLAALHGRSWDRAYEKAFLVLRQCFKWDGGEGSSGSFFNQQSILDAYCWALWSLEMLSVVPSKNPAMTRARRDDWMFLALQRAVELARRVHGEASIPFAELALQLARRAITVGRAPAAVRVTEGAVLPALRAAGRAGAGASPPPTLAERRKNAFFAAWDVTWRSKEARAALAGEVWASVPLLPLSPVCEEDALALLARAAVLSENVSAASLAQAPGEAARAAAQAHLSLLEAAFGVGAPDTAAGLESMRDAALAAKDAVGAEGWARRATEARRGAPAWTVELAEAIEALAALYAVEGPRANKEAAKLLREQALDVRCACGAAGVPTGYRPRTKPDAPAPPAAPAATKKEGKAGAPAPAAPTGIAALLDTTATPRGEARDRPNPALQAMLLQDAEKERQKRIQEAKKRNEGVMQVANFLFSLKGDE